MCCGYAAGRHSTALKWLCSNSVASQRELQLQQTPTCACWSPLGLCGAASSTRAVSSKHRKLAATCTGQAEAAAPAAATAAAAAAPTTELAAAFAAAPAAARREGSMYWLAELKMPAAADGGAAGGGEYTRSPGSWLMWPISLREEAGDSKKTTKHPSALVPDQSVCNTLAARARQRRHGVGAAWARV